MVDNAFTCHTGKVDVVDTPLWPARKGEWHPWPARRLGLGSLPLRHGIAAVVVSLVPTVVAALALSFGTAPFAGIVLGPDYSGRRLSGSSDTCTTGTIAAYGACAVSFVLIAAAFARGLSKNPAIVEIIRQNAEAERDKFLAMAGGAVKEAVKSAEEHVTDKVQSIKDQVKDDIKEGLHDALQFDLDETVSVVFAGQWGRLDSAEGGGMGFASAARLFGALVCAGTMITAVLSRKVDSFNPPFGN